MKKTERKKESAQTMEEQAAVGKISGSGVRMALLYAFPKTVPIMVGYVFLGMAYGILMSVNGFGVFWAALNSLLVYTGSLEFIGVNFLAAAVSPVTAFVMALMISARHIFYGLSMLGKYQNVSKKLKPYLIFALTDETFSIVCEEEPPETISREWMYFWMSLLDQMYWIAGSVMGAALGNVITFNTKGLDFALTGTVCNDFYGTVDRTEAPLAGSNRCGLLGDLPEAVWTECLYHTNDDRNSGGIGDCVQKRKSERE